MTVAVYALTNSTRVPRLTGMRGEPLRIVRIGRIGAVVSAVRRPPAVNAANLRRYHDAVVRLAEHLPAVLPARFGTVLDDAELAFVLRARARGMGAALRHVRGRVQMHVRVAASPEPDSAVRDEAPAPVSGAAYLAGRAEQAARLRDVPELAGVRAVVARWIRDERVERHKGTVSVYHLVPRGAAAAYVRAARRAASAAGVRAVVSGPYPAYAFSTL